MSDTATIDKVEVDSKTRISLRPPSNYNVILYNDDKTAMEFVIVVLTDIFHKTVEDAIALTMHIHNHDKGIAGTYSHEVANQKRSETLSYARATGFPLRCELEKID